MKRIFTSVTLAASFTLTGAVLLVVLMSLGLARSAHAVVGGTTTDAWDVNVGGTFITGSSGFLFGLPCGPAMFGAIVPGCPGSVDTLFADFRPATTHFIEWRTSAPVTIESFNLSANHDFHGPPGGGQCNLPTFLRDAQHRGFSVFILKAFNSATGLFDILLYAFPVPFGDDNTVHPGENARLYDPDALISAGKNILDLTDNVLTSVNTDRWRAEFVQVGCPSNESGPRILELDGFLDPIVTVGGSVTGISPTTTMVKCHNRTTEQKVRFERPPDATSWDCVAEGLDVNLGDEIKMSMKMEGIATAASPLCDSVTDVQFEGNCYYLDGSNGVCQAGDVLAPQSILNSIATSFVGKTYKTAVSNNCCIDHANTATEGQDWGMPAQCNAPGPFTIGPQLGAIGCTNQMNHSSKQLTLCQTQ